MLKDITLGQFFPGSSLLHLKDMDFVVTDIPGYFSTGYHGTVIGAGE